MLDELSVENLGLITEARLEPGPGLVVVTGETGAGKTLLLGAVELLTGGAARRELVGPGGGEAVVQGRFVVGDREVTVLRRVAAEGGRSRAYVDGEMVSAGRLGEMTAGVLELVAQHDQLALTRQAGVRRMVDGALDEEGRAALDDYREAWERVVGLRKDLDLLGGDRRSLERELDVVRFQADEIADEGFSPGDDETLATEVERLRNSEVLAEHLGRAMAHLGDEPGSVMFALDAAIDALRRAARFDEGLDPLRIELEHVSTVAGEVAGSLAVMADSLSREPAALEEAENRVAALSSLKRKYGETLADVLVFGSKAAARAAEITRLLDRAEGLGGELAKAEELLGEHAARLTAARREACSRLESTSIDHLRELGFVDPVVRFVVDRQDATTSGGDAVALRFASNAALEPGPVAKVASGGELSRLVLALRLASGVTEAPVVAFDEIDAGVGGTTALALGRKLAALSRERQVLVVTHLPQVAAFADAHFTVERTGNEVEVRRVSEDERLSELARMLSGLPDSEKGREHAEELLSIARDG